MTEQTNAAAERSAHVTRDAGQEEGPVDNRPFFWVVIEDGQGRLIRYWHTKIRQLPIGARVRFTTQEPKGATPE